MFSQLVAGGYAGGGSDDMLDYRISIADGRTLLPVHLIQVFVLGDHNSRIFPMQILA